MDALRIRDKEANGANREPSRRRHKAARVCVVGWRWRPRPGHARGVQVDLKPDRFGLRCPVEIGVVGDVKATLQGLLPLLQQQRDRAFLSEAQRRMADWNQLLDQIENTAPSPLRPQMVVRTVSDLLSDDAVISSTAARTRTSRRAVCGCELVSGSPAQAC